MAIVIHHVISDKRALSTAFFSRFVIPETEYFEIRLFFDMSAEPGLLDVDIVAVKDVTDGRFDAILIISAPDLVRDIKEFSRHLTLALELDNGLRTEAGVIPIPELKAGRIIYSPTRCVDEDYDDVRCFRKAAIIGIKRAIKAGVERPLVYIQAHPRFNNSPLVTLIGILEGLYVPLHIREAAPHKIHNIKTIGVFDKFKDEVEILIQTAVILESGRRIACDIGDSDPERMAPPKVEHYIMELFAKSSIKITVIKDVKDFVRDYPLFEAVNRGSRCIKRYQGRIMFLEYMPKGKVTKTLFFVGKGVTYDTGGADIKIKGEMAGMSRDKCGAAAVVGFMKMVELMQPNNLRVVVGIGIVRNSIGSNSYVQDELIKARSGVLVRIGYTAADGRMIMADILCKLREMAVDAVNPHLYTIATLTRHAVLTAGFGYNIVIDNGPARKEKHAEKLQLMGEEISDPYEISTLRREDFNFNAGQGVGDDVQQSNSKPSSVTNRGHQCPCAFLIMASGLDKHGSRHPVPLKYSHIDIAASTLNYPLPGTGAPVLSLANAHLLNLLLDLDIIVAKEVADERFDGILIVSAPDWVSHIEEFSESLTLALKLDNGLRTEAGVIPMAKLKANRIIYSPTRCIDEDYDDVRCFRKAANIGIKRAIRAGVERPLVYLLGHPHFDNSALITLIGVLEGLYVPLQVREAATKKIHNINTIGVFAKFQDELDNVIKTAIILETGRRVACDIGDSDPERMAPPKVEQYITELFEKTIKMSIIKDVEDFAKDYPLFEAVNRAASGVERHQGRIMFLEYMPKEEVTKTLFIVGKGVTYDTGGVDIKIKGGMAGMSRDKCGAAAAVGFLKMVELIQPENLRVVVGIGIVRNSVGSDSYVQDELIKARSGVSVRVGNTDAEGRMIMTDILCKLKEMAVDAVNPHLYTIATLTGHAVLTVGYGYNIVIDNGPARKEKHAQMLQLMGEQISDPYEISVLRREDFDFNKGQGVGDDVQQSNNEPSTVTHRGHQCPCAFLIMASGLDKHGSGDPKPLKYSHIDIAPSALTYPLPGTGAPVLSLANTHLLNLESYSVTEWKSFALDVVPARDLNDPQYDGIILVVAPGQIEIVEEFSGVVKDAIALDEGLRDEVGILPIPQFKAKRLVYVPTGNIDVDYDDVRCFRRAGVTAIKRAFKAGVKTPLVYILGHPDYKNAALVTLLGILEGLYVPIQIRESNPTKLHSIQRVGVFVKPPLDVDNLISSARILEHGRRVACDIGDADPERMAPPKVEEYITNLFSGTDISISVVKDIKVLEKEYPLFEAVNRAASNIERHQGRIIFLEYKAKDDIKKTLFLVGKGVTYDTGGADVKAGGVMAGMSRDKCGAAAVAGFFQVLNLLKPSNIRVVGGLSMVRNSIGSNSYVSDELITARSGKLIRIGNTDAEGRMVMADVLCKFKEMAVDAVDPHLYTVATLTGHAFLTVGVGYSIVMDNGPARKSKHAECLKKNGEEISEPFEISTIARGDLDFHKGQAIGDDILQSNNLPSSRTPRGHQGPGAFLILASGLKEHGSRDAVPLKYSHLDIAASAGDFPNPATGAPVLALANKYLL